jgi:hypothetical protein
MPLAKPNSLLTAAWVALSMSVLPLFAACSARACIPSPPIPAFVDASPDAADADAVDAADADATKGPFAVYEAQGGRMLGIAVRPDAKPEPLFEDLPPGRDRFASTASGHTILVTNRFGCDPACLVIDGVPAEADGERIVPSEGRVVMNATGTVLAYQAKGVQHERDVFVIQRASSNEWTTPLNITVRSAFHVNTTPAVSTDGQHIAFDCAKEEGGDTSICEVSKDGGDFRVLVRYDDLRVDGKRSLHRAWYEPSGGLLLEGTSVAGTHVYRSSPPGALPVRVGGFDNDLSPCVLADGRIVTHWLSAPVPHGDALKVMKANGEGFEVIPLGEPIVRGTVSCSG